MESADVRRVESFVGWFMSFRRVVFEHERFDENLAGFAFREDADFSYRVVKRGYVLVQTPKARIDHLKTAAERLTPFELQRMNMANQLYRIARTCPRPSSTRPVSGGVSPARSSSSSAKPYRPATGGRDGNGRGRLGAAPWARARRSGVRGRAKGCGVRPVKVARAAMWGSLGLLAWTHVGYPLAAAGAARLRRYRARADEEYAPAVALVITAHNEERRCRAPRERATGLSP